MFESIGKFDGRLSIGKEWSGSPERSWVVRFCGRAVSFHDPRDVWGVQVSALEFLKNRGGWVPVFTADQVGCYLDGVHGWHNHHAVVDMATERGMVLSAEDREHLETYRNGAPTDVGEEMTGPDGLVDRATEFLQLLTAEGLVWEWDGGELILRVDYGDL